MDQGCDAEPFELTLLTHHFYVDLYIKLFRSRHTFEPMTSAYCLFQSEMKDTYL
jgi:hypothetical protein